MGAGTAGLTTVVVVSADSGPLLGACIDRVLASTAPVEVVLVDNASADGQPEAVEARHAGDARLRVLRNGANLGFGPACNRGAAVARGDALLFLNPDCQVEHDTLARLRALLAADPGLGLLGVHVRDADGRTARAVRRRDPTLRRALMTVTGLARWESRWPALAGVEQPPPPVATEVETVEAVSGACMLLPRAVFERLGGFDEGYFLHCEDLDLCRRVRGAGRAVGLAYAVEVQHAQGSSSRHRPLFVARHKHRGMWRYFARFDPAARNPLLRALVWLGIWGHFALRALPLWWRERAALPA
ncbi:glycosyltransferase family 2 protein [Dokdonella koreensis]|uniref:Glycosyltransferase n=1 Tax=Dokdonella koreensis DS-123 TaxID=1300342 RepID=A0A167GKJ2_9GAMM|nr:glycosyltransferase family 2 protein [Dokdonella koreensis]ANB16662.1 Putative glycosyltransferase [Dokdonella koreensis DS-123]